MCQVDEELARDAQALVYLEGAVDVRVVDEPFPPDGCAWFFEVGPHHDEKGVGVLGLLRKEPLRVFDGRGGVVDGAGADYDEEALLRVGALDDGSGLLAGVDDGVFGGFGLQGGSEGSEWVCRRGLGGEGEGTYLGYFTLQEIWWSQRIDPLYCWTKYVSKLLRLMG